VKRTAEPFHPLKQEKVFGGPGPGVARCALTPGYCLPRLRREDKRAIAVVDHENVNCDNSSIARSPGFIIFWCGSLGSAALHPRLYAVVGSAD
jgi:hypothetical protein